VNTTPQLDLHPDADSLNAFVEQALAVPEREQILVHLAGCSRCRQVIFLAQQAAADAEAPAWVPASRPTKQPTAWYWNWRVAWVPAAALAAALALVVTLHPWRTEPAVEIAKFAPLSKAAAPTPAPKEQASAKVAHMPALARAAKSLAGNDEFDARRRTPEKLAQEPAPSAALSPQPRVAAPSAGVGQAFLPSSIESAPQQETTKQYQPEPAVAAWQQEQQQRSGASSDSADASRQISQKSMRAEAYTAHVSRKAAPAGPRMVQQSQSMPASSFDIVTQQQLTGAAASRKVNASTLPSGLPAVSMATVQHLTLEIDLAGTLFLSDDSGEHWEPIARQWTGHAVEVRAKTGLSGKTATAGVFELKNDAGSSWASVDGKTWSAQ
jgi:hypothetical protein